MTITTQDIKLFASKVMSDVPEGGGGPSAVVLQTGKSNNIFRDIREQDRAGGNLSMRQVHLGITTADAEVAMGANLIISEPPSDPNVSIVLMSTASDFATRAQDIARLEAGFVAGTAYHGTLLGDHVRGMRTMNLLQRAEAALPTPGQRLALVYREGYSDAVTQFVSVRKVEHTVQQFEDDKGVFERRVVSLQLGQALERDFPGFDATRVTLSETSIKTRTRVRSTIWGNAAQYYGIKPLVAAGAPGQFTVQASGIYERVVPSAEAETALLDVRVNGAAQALVSAGGPVTRSITLAFTTTQALHLGAPLMPGSLQIVRGGITLTDKGARLMQGATEVGALDYDNGIATLTTNVFGASGGTHAVTLTPAAVPELITRQHAIHVSAESVSQSYAFVMPGSPPLPRGLQIAYLARGNWYVLRDDGGGVISGGSSDAGVGVGTVNYATGGIQLTLGALPDVGSIILVQAQTAAEVRSNTTLEQGERLYAALNTSGQASDERGAKPITAGSALVQWSDGQGGSKSAMDDGLGALTGDASGSIDYSAGVVRISPHTLPPPGTVFLLDTDATTPETAASVSLANGSLGHSGVAPGSVSLDVQATIHYALPWVSYYYRLAFETRNVTLTLFDNGAGALQFRDPGNGQVVTVGAVDYAAGTIDVTDLAPTLAAADVLGPTVHIKSSAEGMAVDGVMDWSMLAGLRALTITSTQAGVRFAPQGAGSDSVSVVVNAWQARVLMVPGYQLRGVSFELGGTAYQQITDGALVRNLSPASGQGTPAGSVSAPAGVVYVQSWPASASSLIAHWRGVITPPGDGVEAPYTAFQTMLRTAASPLRPGSLQIVCEMQDGTVVNATADAAGKLNHARLKGRVDVQFGFAELYFVNANGSPDLTVDLSHLDIAGVSTMPVDLVRLPSLRYSAVAYEYIPIDPEIIGVNPVRLPSDGRVPIFEPGYYTVVHTHEVLEPQTVEDGQTIDLEIERLSRIVIWDADGIEITWGWARDLDAGTLQVLACSDWVQPIRIGWSIEHMALARDVQITGQITLNRALTHHFPVGKSFISSALMLGDRYARVSLLFDQSNWDGVSYLDHLSGNAATATYNTTVSPVEVDNTGCITQRWAIHFQTPTTVRLVGESVGVVLTGHPITQDLAPINPNTGTPYFVMRKAGFGADWAAQNVIRMNTAGAGAGLSVVRAVQPGDYTALDHRFALLARVDIDRPGSGD